MKTNQAIQKGIKGITKSAIILAASGFAIRRLVKK